MSVSAAPRRARLTGSLALVAFAVGALGGYEGFATDTPLGVITTAHVLAPGEPVTGDVIHPDGTMRVTLSPRDVSHVDGEHSDGAMPCEYESGEKTFSCPTVDMAQGLYLVQVADGAQPGDWTAVAQVAIAPFEGYDPMVSRRGEDAGGAEPDAQAGEPVRLVLTGRRPEVPVRVALVCGGGPEWDAATLTPGRGREAEVDDEAPAARLLHGRGDRRPVADRWRGR